MGIMKKGGDIFSYLIDTIKTIIDKFIEKEQSHHKGNFNYAIGRPILKGVKFMMELNVTNEEKILVSCNPVTLAGNPVTLDGTIVVSLQSGDGNFEVQPDGKSVFLISGLLPGDSTFIIQADADLGEGVENISDVIVLHVAGAKAASFGLVAGTPVLK